MKFSYFVVFRKVSGFRP